MGGLPAAWPANGTRNWPQAPPRFGSFELLLRSRDDLLRSRDDLLRSRDDLLRSRDDRDRGLLRDGVERLELCLRSVGILVSWGCGPASGHQDS
jgi:hypothetical protein